MQVKPMTSINSFNSASGRSTLSTNHLIKNLINLLAFKYQVLGIQDRLTLNEQIEKKIEFKGLVSRMEVHVE